MDFLVRRAWCVATLLVLGACTGSDGNGATNVDPSGTAGSAAAMLADKVGSARIEPP
jgi:hypothetical protein